jgi:hypothetical protein
MYRTIEIQAERLVQGGLVLVLLCGLIGCGPAQQPSGQGPSTGTGSRVDPQADATRRRQVQSMQQTLANSSPELDALTRQAAAGELLELWTRWEMPTARAALADALKSTRADQVNAVIAAIQVLQQPPPALRPAALAALRTAPPSCWPTLGALLDRFARHDPSLIDQIERLVIRSPTETFPKESRTRAKRAAIVVLGAFHNQPARAVAILMELLQRPITPNRLMLVSASLSQLTGIPTHDEVQWWLSWWDENQGRPATQWLIETIRAQSRRIASLESEVERGRDDNRLLVSRMIAAIGDLWPLLEANQQLGRLPDMLEDDRPEIRGFAVERVAVLLRDGQATEALEQAVVERLGDPEVSIRRQVSNLLTELSNPNIIDRVTAQLEVESDREVLHAALHFLQTRGDPTNLAKVLPLLKREETREAAAATIWSLVRLSTTSRETQIALLDALPPDDRSTPALAALAILARPAEGFDRNLNVLQHDDTQTRAAIAEALLRRSQFAILLENSRDPAVYPHAIGAAIAMPTGQPLQRVDRLLELAPQEATQRDLWIESLNIAATEVVTQDIEALDDRLRDHEAVGDDIRITILNRAVAAEDLPDPLRLALLRRLVPLLLKARQARPAVALLDAIPEDQLDTELTDLRFRAALMSRLFDTAAEVHPTVEPWIDFYEEIQTTYREESDAVREEIIRRFNDSLDEAMLTRLGVAMDPLMPAPPSSSAADASHDEPRH